MSCRPSFSFYFLISTLIFASCFAGSGLLKYDGCRDWTCGMNPWKLGGAYQLSWLLKFCITTFLHICLLWNEKKILWTTFHIFFLHSAFLAKWYIEFICLYSLSANKAWLLALLNCTLFKVEVFEQIRWSY